MQHPWHFSIGHFPTFTLPIKVVPTQTKTSFTVFHYWLKGNMEKTVCFATYISHKLYKLPNNTSNKPFQTYISWHVLQTHVFKKGKQLSHLEKTFTNTRGITSSNHKNSVK
jgi:hypothetical protein